MLSSVYLIFIGISYITVHKGMAHLDHTLSEASHPHPQKNVMDCNFCFHLFFFLRLFISSIHCLEIVFSFPVFRYFKNTLFINL